MRCWFLIFRKSCNSSSYRPTLAPAQKHSPHSARPYRVAGFGRSGLVRPVRIARRWPSPPSVGWGGEGYDGFPTPPLPSAAHRVPCCPCRPAASRRWTGRGAVGRGGGGRETPETERREGAECGRGGLTSDQTLLL